jgi:pimeloyl-ACP methyl ester carboxylesterase
MTKQIVFITGAFVIHHCWDEWAAWFQAKGFSTVAPPWPYKDGPSAAALRNRQPNDVDLALLTLEQVVNHYENVIRSFPEKPIIIGHSLGGLITQILVNRGLAAAGVAIHSIPPQGVFPYEFSFLKAGWKVLGLFTPLRETYLMSFKDWQYAFVNGMPLEEQKAAWEKFTIPESKTVARGGLSSAARVDFKKPHAPLLLTAGSTDTITPAHLNRRNFKAYHKNGSVLEYKEFEGRNHFVLGAPGWEGDAQFVHDWLVKQLAGQPGA